MIKSAKFSPCRAYRYTLWRIWDKSKPYAMFIGLNPSTADEVNDDPTVRRCINYSRDWGYGGLCMTNIFAYRATDPKNMISFPSPIGPRNNFWLKKSSKKAGIIVAAWGTKGEYKNRGSEVIELIDNLQCLRITKDGHPQHPLYLSKNIKPIKFERIDNEKKY